MRTTSVGALLVCVMLGVLLAVPLHAQPAEPAPGGPVPGVVGGNPAAAALARDVEILQIVRMLDLTTAQIQSALPILTDVQAKVQAFRQTEDTLWQQSSVDIQGVIDAWTAGKAANAAGKQASDKAVADYNAAKNALDAAVAQAAGQIRGLLNRNQQAYLETAQQAAQRQRAQVGLEGADSLADFIARHIQILRTLTPDEYRAVRIVEAQSIAAHITAPRARDFDSVTLRIVDVLDRAANWSEEQYTANKPQLTQMVAQALSLPGTAAGFVRYDDFLGFVRDPRTVPLLTQVSGGAAAPEVAPLATVAMHPLELAMRQARTVAILNELQVSLRQLGQLSPLAGAVSGAAQSYDSGRSIRRGQVQGQLSDAVRALLAGQQVDDVTAATLALLVAGDAKAKGVAMRSAAEALATVKRVFSAEQNAVIDWTLPASASVEPDTAVATAEARRIAAEMRSALDFLDSVRYLPIDLYFAARTGKIEQYLARYFDPQTADYNRGRQYLFDLTNEAKGVQENRWRAAAPFYAARMLHGLGVVQDVGTQEASNRAYDWQAMFDLFSAPQTGTLIQNMVKARTAAGM